MKWQTAKLQEVAPAKTADIQFQSDDIVWQLTLDQIEGHTGYILDKRMAPASESGSSTFIFDTNNVLYSKLRPYLNKVVHPQEPGIATTELVPLRPRQDVLHPDYLTYYLRSNHFLSFAEQCVAGVKMPRIIMTKFWQHQIPLPPLSEQHRIVEILAQADALQKKRAGADAKAERIIPALFYKMFGDAATNPRGWQRGKLGDVIVETMYGTSTRANTKGEGVVVIRMNNINAIGRLNLGDLKHVVLTEKELKKHLLEPGDLLFNRTNSRELVGKTGLWRGKMEAVPASYLIRVRVNPQRALPEYVWAYMNTPFIKQILFDKARRAIGMANINAQELREFPAIFPDISFQQSFAEKLAMLDELIEYCYEAEKKVDSLFQTLLYRAFSGELIAKWREAHTKELLTEMEEQTKELGLNEKTTDNLFE